MSLSSQRSFLFPSNEPVLLKLELKLEFILESQELGLLQSEGTEEEDEKEEEDEEKLRRELMIMSSFAFCTSRLASIFSQELQSHYDNMCMLAYCNYAY